MQKIEISTYGNLLMYKKNYSAEFIENTIKKEKLNGLRIFAHLKKDRLESFEFLKEFTFLEGLEIVSLDDLDFEFLKYLPKLKHLSLDIKGTKKIDLSLLPNLVYCSLNWRENLVGLNACVNIEDLCLIGYDKENLNEINFLRKLKRLKILSASIKTLKGIEMLKNMEYFKLGNCKYLENILSINNFKNLKELIIEKCPALYDVKYLNGLTKLKELQIIDCGEIATITFIATFSSLEKLMLLGNTIVGDGNVKVAKNIKEVFIAKKEHYNHSFQNLLQKELQTKNINKLKELFTTR